MKVPASIIAAPLLVQGALAFVPTSPSGRPPVASTALNAERQGNSAAAAAASALLAGSLTLLSSQAVFANDDAALFQQQSTMGSSSVSVAEIEEFSLPSYDASKGTKLIDLSGEVETVNKKTLDKAKARREFEDKSAEKLEADALRKAEKEGGGLLDSMLGSAELDRKAAIEAEKAEARANRWNTF